MVEVEMQLVGGGFGNGESGVHHQIGYSTNVYRYNYVVQSKIDGLENELKTKAEPIKKGFLSKEMVGLKWEGGSLAQLLNADLNLKTKLLQGGLIEMRPDKTNKCVRMRQKPFHSKTTLALQTREAFEIYDRIARNIWSIASTQP